MATVSPVSVDHREAMRLPLILAAPLGAAIAVSVVLSPTASATELGYLKALEDAGVLSIGGDPCHMMDGACIGRFTDINDALSSGHWVCDQIAGGKPKSLIIQWMSNGEGLMPSPYNANAIVNAATANLC